MDQLLSFVPAMEFGPGHLQIVSKTMVSSNLIADLKEMLFHVDKLKDGVLHTP